MDGLPVEIIFNIFSRLPIKSILQFRCVSESWCNIIDDPFLAKLHITRGIEETSVLVLLNPTYKKEVASLYLVKEDGNRSLKASKNPITKLPNLGKHSLQGSCNGLLYFANSNDTEGVFVLNPFTGQSKTLPHATIENSWPRMKKYGLGYDFSTNTYKIVRIVRRDSFNWAVEVHTLGTNSWREINDVPPFSLGGKPVSAYGALHWIIDPLFRLFSGDDNRYIKFMIISFDIKKEEFKFTSHPDFGSKTCNLFHLVDLGGGLAMVDRSSNTCIDIWVVKDYDKKEWMREYRINIKAPAGWPDNSRFKVIGLREHGEILLSYYTEYYSYNPKTNEIRYILTPGLIPDTNSSNSSEVYSHKGSLVSCYI